MADFSLAEETHNWMSLQFDDKIIDCLYQVEHKSMNSSLYLNGRGLSRYFGLHSGSLLSRAETHPIFKGGVPFVEYAIGPK